MADIAVKDKINLGELLAKGHSKFGKVLPRRPYYEESDDEGGSGTGSSKLLLQHPLFAQLPVGAPSDLSHLIAENGQTIDQLESRSSEACPQLRKNLENALRYGYKPPAKLTMYNT